MLAMATLLHLLCANFATGTATHTNVNITSGNPWDFQCRIQQGEMRVCRNTTTTGRPRDCDDLIQQGNVYEGHYVVYPDTDAPNKASMIHCSLHDGMEPLPKDIDRKAARNCLDLLHAGVYVSGVNVIYPYSEHPTDPVLVLCDQDLDGGGWTVIQHRFDGSEEFYRPWVDYEEGFGNVAEEHYLGNDKIAELTGQCVNELQVELEDFDGLTAYAHYDAFHVDPRFNYQLQVFNYQGTAGDPFMIFHNGRAFTTFDADHDDDNYNDNDNCAVLNHGAWWYRSCQYSNLNGRYYPSTDHTTKIDGVRWSTFRGKDSLKTTKMLVRPYGFPMGRP